jgi:pyrophosphatase PpaX
MRGYDQSVRFPVVLFDLDGTLLDSGWMILASMRHATRIVLEREIPEDELLARVGGSGLHEQMRAFDPDRVEDLVAVYREHNEPLHQDVVACAGVLPLLDRLRAEGRRLGVVTAKRHATVALAAHALPFLDGLDVIVGWDDTERHKPHADPILHALDQLDAAPEDAAYVGDSPFDIAAARAAEVFAVAVTWGRIHSSELLEAEEPDAVVDTPEELYAVL